MRTVYLRPIVCLMLLLPGLAAATTLTARQASQDADILIKSLRALHPALDKYRGDAQVEASFAHFKERAGQARSAAAMYLAATELAASIRCGHTWTNVLNQQGAIKRQLLEAPDKLPLTMTLVDRRWRVLASAVPGIAAGDELLSIDGKDTAQVIAGMLPYLRADGASDGKRLRQLGHDRPDYSMMDIVWPLLSPPAAGVYQLTVRTGDGAVRQLAAGATTLAAREAVLKQGGAQPRDDAWRLRIDGARAVMTLPTFAFYRTSFDWRAFFADSFATLRRQHVERLVIDIRDNEGGDGAIGMELLSYLVTAPLTTVSDQSVTMYERVPYALARYLDTWDFGFFDRTGQVDRIVDGPQADRWRFRPNAYKTHTITPSAERFTGRSWLLVGPENSSATFSLAQLIQQTGAAMLVGQPTGGNLRGLNGGQLAWVTLPNSGVAVDIPLLAASYQAATPDASITPDILVRRTFKGQVENRDEEMAAVASQAR
jgi:hypothetical protein